MSSTPEFHSSRPVRRNSVSLFEIILITLAGCLVFALNNGVRVNYGLLSTAIESASGIAAASVSFAIAIAQLFYGISQPLFGALALKKSNSLVLILGSGLLCGGFLLVPLCTSAWLLNLALGVLVGCGTGALAFGIVMSAVTPVIGEHRAAGVSGIINGAGGIGGAALAPLAQLLLDGGGLKTVMFGLTVVSALIAVISFWLYGREKASRSTAGQEAGENQKLSAVIAEAFHSSAFLHVALAFFTCGFFMAIIETQFYSQILSLGFSGTTAALAFSIYGIMGMIGPVISGFLCVKTKCKWVLGTFYALRPVAILIFLLLPKTLFTVFFFTVFLGLIGNATVPPTTNLLSKLFGFQKLGMLLGTAFVFHQIGSFISTWLGGILTTATGSYTLLWLLGAALAAAAALLSYTVKE